jgi:hypothetical protein
MVYFAKDMGWARGFSFGDFIEMGMQQIPNGVRHE